MRHCWLVAVLCGAMWMPQLHAQSDFAGKQSDFAGKWQGQNAGGRRVAADFAVTGSRLTGTFTLDKQTVPIAEGKIVERTCSFRISIDGRTPAVSGEVLRDQLTLSVEGVPNPVLLRRVK